MNLLFILIVIFIAAGLIILKMKQPPTDDGLAFARKDSLFTPAERSFLGVLEQALDSRYRVFGKVRLGDIIKPAKGLTNSKRTTASNKVNQKHVDFVVCSASDLTVVGVVELDDKSHERDDRSSRDKLVDRALADAKIPVIHFSAKKGYVISEIKAKLAECLANGKVPLAPPVIQGSPVPETPASVPQEAAIQVTEKPETASVTLVKPVTQDTAPICPKCASAMVKRQAAKGPHAGRFFWACSKFPKCRQVVPVGEN